MGAESEGLGRGRKVVVAVLLVLEGSEESGEGLVVVVVSAMTWSTRAWSWRTPRSIVRER